VCLGDIISWNVSKIKLANVDEIARLQGLQKLADHVSKDCDGRIGHVQSDGGGDCAGHDEEGTGASAQVKEIALFEDPDEFVPSLL
jgi:hypothetical protein